MGQKPSISFCKEAGIKSLLRSICIKRSLGVEELSQDRIISDLRSSILRIFRCNNCAQTRDICAQRSKLSSQAIHVACGRVRCDLRNRGCNIVSGGIDTLLD